ncbi:hypothetical protein RDWZM_005732 [Blomia tropicalis]|uniref:Uncharacterized protein n=1 Tax=Blomia tropicalis TaxID=40697 RepID=A0A9Q0MA44_BLOTA|nr:hypothetical protein RDWZM_005732 [Blomia tropicalis]
MGRRFKSKPKHRDELKQIRNLVPEETIDLEAAAVRRRAEIQNMKGNVGKKDETSGAANNLLVLADEATNVLQDMSNNKIESEEKEDNKNVAVDKKLKKPNIKRKSSTKRSRRPIKSANKNEKVVYVDNEYYNEHNRPWDNVYRHCRAILRRERNEQNRKIQCTTQQLNSDSMTPNKERHIPDEVKKWIDTRRDARKAKLLYGDAQTESHNKTKLATDAKNRFKEARRTNDPAYKELRRIAKSMYKEAKLAKDKLKKTRTFKKELSANVKQCKPIAIEAWKIWRNKQTNRSKK